ncbi:MAG: hypothetical protein AAF184_22555 [Pseudomonadota bacterium]
MTTEFVIDLEEIARLPSPEGFSLVSIQIRYDGVLLALFVRDPGVEAVTETVASSIGIFPQTRTQEAHAYKLYRIDAESCTCTDLPALDITFPMVDVFPDGHIILAGARSSWRAPDDVDLNGAIVSPSGELVRRILLGDGIQHLAVDRLGRIWVGYFDEGICGNFGWGGPGPDPVGASGLVCFAPDGSRLWEFPFASEPEVIDDCYAMNVFGDSAYFYFYSDFSLCHAASDHTLQYWQTGLSGCSELAVLNDWAMFNGQYDDPPNTIYSLTLATGAAPRARKGVLRLPDGDRSAEIGWIGRGDSLNVVKDGVWCSARLRDLRER